MTLMINSWKRCSNKRTERVSFFFFFQLHPCCISAFFPNYTLYSDASVLNNALKSLYVHMCVCAEL